MKRALDVTAAPLLLALLSPVMAVVALCVRLSSPGPILFRQQRIGKDGRPFCLYKFRTMWTNCDQSVHKAYHLRLIRNDAPSFSGTYKLANDARVTPLGRVLRRYSLDELPQLINVMRGDMSLVGPRPAIRYEVENYTPRELARLSAPPGLTGLWQVSGRNMLTFHEMIELDLAYIAHWSVWLDIQILLRTPAAVFSGRGAA